MRRGNLKFKNYFANEENEKYGIDCQTMQYSKRIRDGEKDSTINNRN